MYIVPNTQLDLSDELNHHGILGMKWGIRRFQPYPKGDKKGKEVGEAAKVGAGRKALMAIGKGPVKVGQAINNKRKEKLKQFKDDTAFYEKYGRASKEKYKGQDIKKKWLAEGDYYADKYLYGKKGIKRIRDKVEKQGTTLKQARRSENIRYYARAVATTAATMGGIYLYMRSPQIKAGFKNAADMIKNNKNFVNTSGYTLNSDLFLPLKKK